jgi:hypothetical protein
VFPVRCEMGSYIPEDGILHSHRRENLKPYTALLNLPRCEYLKWETAFKEVPQLAPVMPARVAVRAYFHLFCLRCAVTLHARHVSRTSAPRDVHIRTTAHTLAHLGVTDNSLETASNYNKLYSLINTSVESPWRYSRRITNNTQSPSQHYRPT